MISTSDFKNGLTIIYDNTLYKILYFQHVKPGKGGAFVRTKLKNLDTGATQDKTFRAGEKMEQAILETKKMQFLYKDEHYNFMDMANYEQIQLSEDQVSDEKDYFLENMELSVVYHNDRPISIELPIFIEASVVETEPGIKGDTVGTSFKPAKIETGAKVQVPLFINDGDRIKIDTRTGEYITRV
ncbi:MAG: elongation factor P [Actinomycetota bacterium]|nr:MAG: elongation factor P [Actinomycetota bacterium]